MSLAGWAGRFWFTVFKVSKVFNVSEVKIHIPHGP